jgi:hypothetical protein
MAEVIVGAFSNRDYGYRALDQFRVNGFMPEDTSVILREIDESGRLEEGTVGKVGGGAATGAVAGATLGSLAGLVIGASAIILPGVGPIVVAGPLAAAIAAAGATTGAVAGGILGSLAGMGISKEKAEVYKERISSGDMVVAVRVDSRTRDLAESVFKQNNAEEIGAFAVA